MKVIKWVSVLFVPVFCVLLFFSSCGNKQLVIDRKILDKSSVDCFVDTYGEPDVENGSVLIYNNISCLGYDGKMYLYTMQGPNPGVEPSILVWVDQIMWLYERKSEQSIDSFKQEAEDLTDKLSEVLNATEEVGSGIEYKDSDSIFTKGYDWTTYKGIPWLHYRIIYDNQRIRIIIDDITPY